MHRQLRPPPGVTHPMNESQSTRNKKVSMTGERLESSLATISPRTDSPHGWSNEATKSSLGSTLGGVEDFERDSDADLQSHANGGGFQIDVKADTGRIVARRLIINLIFILLWYIFALLLSLYNKWMFSPDNLDFHFPLFVTSSHMLVQFTLSSLVLFFVPTLRPPTDQTMSRFYYLTRIGPCGAATGLDIGLGNTSLKFITLAFYTMCKSSSLAFVLVFAFLFRLEKPTWKLVSVITVMTLGVIMMVASETDFVLIGFLLVITASALSGLRWSLTQILLLRNPATSNPFSSIFFLSPIMFLSLIVIAFPAEGYTELINAPLWREQGILPSIGIILFPGVIAFLMTASEFTLLQRTSVVTLSIAGIFKEVITISAAALTFGDQLTPINITGLLVTIAAIAAYNYMRFSRMKYEVETKLLDQADEEAEDARLVREEYSDP